MKKLFIKDVKPGDIFKPFKSSSNFYCIEIYKTMKSKDAYSNKDITATKMKVLSINLNTFTVTEIVKNFPHKVSRGMFATLEPVTIDKLSLKDLFNKIFKESKE